MANEMKKIQDIVTGFRNAIQDLLVPELKAIKKQLESHEQEFTRIWEEIKILHEEIKLLHQEMNARFEIVHEEIRDLRHEMNVRFEAVHQEIKDIRHEMNVRFEAVHQEMKELRKEVHELKSGQREILLKLDIEKRVNKLEILVQDLRRGEVVVSATG